MQNLALEAHVLKSLMGSDKSQSSGLLVALAALRADQTVFHHVKATEAVAARDLVELVNDIEVARLFTV